MFSSASVHSSTSYFLEYIHEFYRASQIISTSISAVDLICIFTRASCFVVYLIVFRVSDPRALAASPCYSGLRNLDFCNFERFLSCRALPSFGP